MANLLGRTSAGFGGAVSSKNATLSIGTADPNVRAGVMLIQNLGVQYSQNITQVLELQSDLIYLAVARTQGMAQLGTVFGPKNAEAVIYAELADPCKTHNLVYRSTIGCTSGDTGQRTVTREAKHFTLQQYGFNVTVQDGLVQENMAGPVVGVDVS